MYWTILTYIYYLETVRHMAMHVHTYYVQYEEIFVFKSWGIEPKATASKIEVLPLSHSGA